MPHMDFLYSLRARGMLPIDGASSRACEGLCIQSCDPSMLCDVDPCYCFTVLLYIPCCTYTARAFCGPRGLPFACEEPYFVGLRLVQAAFPTGAMWAAAEAHAAWLVGCAHVHLYAPSTARGGPDGDDSGSFAVRRCKAAGWDEVPAKVCDSATV